MPSLPTCEHIIVYVPRNRMLFCTLIQTNCTYGSKYILYHSIVYSSTVYTMKGYPVYLLPYV
jgi:hypothetical protein